MIAVARLDNWRLRTLTASRCQLSSPGSSHSSLAFEGAALGSHSRDDWTFGRLDNFPLICGRLEEVA